MWSKYHCRETNLECKMCIVVGLHCMLGSLCRVNILFMTDKWYLDRWGYNCFDKEQMWDCMQYIN